MGILFIPNYQLALESGHTILPQHTIESCKRAYYFPQLPFVPSKWAYYFSKTVGSSKRVHYFSPTTKWLKQAGILFFPNYQLAQASGHIISPQLPNGSSKRAYYFSPTINWLQQAGILFFPHSIGSSKRAYFSKTLNWLQEAGIFFPITNWLQQACI